MIYDVGPTAAQLLSYRLPSITNQRQNTQHFLPGLAVDPMWRRCLPPSSPSLIYLIDYQPNSCIIPHISPCAFTAMRRLTFNATQLTLLFFLVLFFDVFLLVRVYCLLADCDSQ